MNLSVGISPEGGEASETYKARIVDCDDFLALILGDLGDTCTVSVHFHTLLQVRDVQAKLTTIEHALRARLGEPLRTIDKP